MTLTTRANGDNIEASWFNDIKTEFEYSATGINYEVKTSDYTSDLTEIHLAIDASSTAVTVTIPAASGNTGKKILVRANDVTNTAKVTETGVGDVVTFSNVGDAVHLVSNGSAWLDFSGFVGLTNHMSDTSTHGVSTVAGLSEVQTFTNKTLTSPKINEDVAVTATATEINQLDDVSVGGNTSGDIVTTDDTQTLTNKTLNDCTLGGTTTVVNSTNLDVADKNITLNDGGNEASAAGAGITVEKSDATDSNILHDNALASEWKLGEVGSEAEVVTVSHTQTLTNKTLTSPNLNEAVAVTATATEVNQLDGVTVGGASAGDIATIDDTQILTNKAISSPSQLDVKKDTYANLVTYASTASNGQLCFATDTKVMYQVKDSVLADVTVSSSTTTDDYATYNADTTSYTSFDATGLINASLGEESSNHLNGSKSYKLTNHASAAAEELQAPSTTLALRSRAKTNSVKFQYTYDGTSDYIRAFVYDVTNTTELAELLLDAASSSTMASIPFFPLSSTASIELRFDIQTGEAASLVFDDIEFSDSPYVYKDLINMTDWETYTPSNTQGFGTVTSPSFKWRRVGGSMEIQAEWTCGTTTASEAQIELPNSEVVSSIMAAGTEIVGKLAVNKTVAADFNVLATDGDTFLNFSAQGVSYNGASPTNASTLFGTGERLSFFASVPIEGWSAKTEHVICPRISYKPVRYNSSTAQIINNASADRINFENKDWDKDSLVTTGAFWVWTSEHAGLVNVFAAAQMAAHSVVADDFFEIHLYKNGSQHSVLYSQIFDATNTRTLQGNGGDDVEVAVDDTLDIRIYQSTNGGAGTLTADSDYNYVTIKYIDNGADLVGAPIQQTMYIDVHATDYRVSTAGTTSYKAIPLVSTSGDIFGTISSNQLTIGPGEYRVMLPVGSYNGAGNVSARIWDTAGAGSTIEEFLNVAWSVINSESTIPVVRTTITLTETKTIEFRTKASNAAGSEQSQRITLIKVKEGN